MKRTPIILLLLFFFCQTAIALAVEKEVTVTWSMADTTNVSGYRLYYDYDSSMGNKTLACETTDPAATSLTCTNVDLQQSPVYFVLAAVKNNTEEDSSPSSQSFDTATATIFSVRDFKMEVVNNPPAPPGDNQGSATISNVSPAYPVYPLEVGKTLYTDRNYTSTDISPALQNSQALRTANNDKSNTQAEFLTFTVDRNITLYIAYDSRATTYPSWLTQGYSRTSMTIKSTDSGGELDYSVWSRPIPAGTVTIPGNLYGAPANVGSMYLVIIQ